MMSGKSPPIVIRQSDIDKCVPLKNRPTSGHVVLSPSDIAEALHPEGLGYPEKAEEESATGTKSFSHFTWVDILLALVTLPIPFANALFWFSAGYWKGCDRLIAYWVSGVLFAASSVAAFLVVIHFGNNNDWSERIAAGARHSIVRIQIGQNMGTGFVIGSEDDRHLILTNRHVVSHKRTKRESDSGSGEIFSEEVVVIHGGRHLIGQIVAVMREPEVDMVLILVRSDSLRPLGRLRPYMQIHQGEEVIAIGHPAGLDYTVTRGTVSAKREGVIIQTDAALNPGSSGGPLIGRDGAVLGINTAIMSENEEGKPLQGINFALRADVAADASRWESPEGAKLKEELLRIIRTIKS
jgi:S1-C subfamily serine protease